MPPLLRCIAVDSEEAWLEIMAREFERSAPAFTLLKFTNTFDALEHLSENRADVIVADVHFPELDGLHLCEAVREFDPSVPIVLVSIDESQRAAALLAGANEFMSKRLLRANIVPTLRRLTARATVRG